MEIDEATFKLHLSKVIGKQCWAIISGSGTGSVLSLKFGKRLARAKPLKNRSLSRTERYYEGEFAFVLWSAWDLFQFEERLSNWTSCNKTLMPETLSNLKGVKLLAIEILLEKPEFILSFEEGYTLKATNENQDPADDLVSFFYHDFCYTLTNGGKLDMEEV